MKSRVKDLLVTTPVNSCFDYRMSLYEYNLWHTPNLHGNVWDSDLRFLWRWKNYITEKLENKRHLWRNRIIANWKKTMVVMLKKYKCFHLIPTMCYLPKSEFNWFYTILALLEYRSFLYYAWKIFMIISSLKGLCSMKWAKQSDLFITWP